ncbi:MAG: SRPBCC family protein [Aggregatilineales bacterium]
MATIDQRILIPASQEAVWNFISDLSNNPSWQVDCKSVSFITSKRSGQGARWRMTNDRGRDAVAEITTWYNGLGYEYIFVDGVPFRSSRGRIRLQEIAEGTIVQWTFTYEMGGILGGIRSPNRHIETTMAESLKTLYRVLKRKGSEGVHEVKSLMRDAPDVEARAQYKPRHPSIAVDSPKISAPAAVLVVEPEISEGDAEPLFAFHFPEEPPVAADDTRPRPALASVPTLPPERLEPPVPVTAIPPDFAGEPEFLNHLYLDGAERPPVTIEDTQPQPAANFEFDDLPAPAAGAPANSELDSLFEGLEPSDSYARFAPPSTVGEQPNSIKAGSDIAFTFEVAPPQALPTAEAAVEPKLSATDERPLDLLKAEANPLQAEAKSTSPYENVMPSPALDDTATKSIWEIFGVPRPSETGAIAPVGHDDAKTKEKEEAAQLEAVGIKPAIETDEASLPAETIETPILAESIVAAPRVNDEQALAFAAAVAPIAPSAMDAKPTELEEAVSISSITTVTMTPRVGLRLLHRRQLVRLRRPN